LITRNPAWSALMFFAVLTVISLTLAGRTPGHAMVGLRVARLDGLGRPGFSRAVVRTLLLLAAVPALLSDVDGRGLHDRAAGTVVLRTR
jgi:uncharacterized RDD family membrane protein YckC